METWRCFNFVCTQVLEYFTHSCTYYTFSTCFNENVPWLTQCRGTSRYLGRVSWYALWVTISPFVKGLIRASTPVSPLRVTIAAQLTRCMHRLSHQNKSWHHQSIMWRHPDDVRDFRLWYLCQHWKGIKGRCMRGWGFQLPIPGFQVLSFECLEPS